MNQLNFLFSQVQIYRKRPMGNYSHFKHNCKTYQDDSATEFKGTIFAPVMQQVNKKEPTAMRLSDFRSQLQQPQCFYVLNTLLQQYYSLLKQFSKVVVSDQICHVTKLGQVKVDFYIDGPQTHLSLYNQVTHSQVTIVSQILEMIALLAMDKKWIQSSECSQFQQKLTEVIYKHHLNEEKLHQELLHQTNSYLERNNIRCNLLSAVIRRSQPLKQQEPLFFMKESLVCSQTPYIAQSRARSQSQCVNPNEQNRFSEFSVNQIEEPSTMIRIKDNSTKVDSNVEYRIRASLNNPKTPLYRHKMVRTQGETYFNNMHSQHQEYKDYRNNETYFSQMPPTERPLSKQESSNSIAAQYSIHIMNSFAKKKQSKTNLKVNFKDSLKSKRPSIKVVGEQKNYFRQCTSINELQSKTSSKKKSFSKSVLNELARDIHVQDEPSSRSYIF